MSLTGWKAAVEPYVERQRERLLAGDGRCTYTGWWVGDY